MNSNFDFSHFSELDPKEQEKIVFEKATQSDIAFFENLLKNNVKLDNFQMNGNNLIHETAQNGDTKLFELIKDQFDIDSPNVDGKTALHIAVECDQIHMVQELLKNGAKLLPDRNNYTPLDYAKNLQNNKIKILIQQFKFYKGNGENIVSQGVFDSILEDNDAAIQKRISEKKNFYVRNDEGRTPLHYAVEMGDLEIVKILLNTMDPNVLDSSLNTSLQTAIDNGQITIGNYLKSKGGITFNNGDEQPEENEEAHEDDNKYFDQINEVFNDLPDSTIPDTADIPSTIDEKHESEDVDEIEEVEQSPIKEDENVKQQTPKKERKKRKPKKKENIDIFKAIEEQNVKNVSLYCKRKGNLLVTDENGKFPLYLALKTGNYRLIKPLCTLEAIMALEKTDYPILCRLVERRDLKLIRLLGISGANPKHKNSKNKTPMEIAFEIPNKNKDKKDIIFSLSLAYLNYPWDFLQFITEHEDIYKKYKIDYILHTVMNDRIEILLILLERGISINQEIDGRSLLHIAIEYGSEQCAKRLLKLKCELKPDNDGIDEIEKAVYSKHYSRIILAKVVAAYQKKAYALMDDAPAFINSFPVGLFRFPAVYFLLERAVIHLQLDVIKFLINEGHLTVNCIGARNRTLLHFAAMVKNLNDENRNKMLQIIIFLKKNGANINALDSFQRLPLHYAAQIGYVEIVAELLGCKENCIHKDILSKTPYDLATDATTKQLLLTVMKRVANDMSIPEDNEKMLIQYMANSNQISLDIIHVCLQKDYLKAFKIIFDGGFGAGEANKANIYAIHECVHSNSQRVCKFLLLNGFNVNQKDKGTLKIPLHIAFEDNNIEMAKMLIHAGSKNSKDKERKSATDYASKDDKKAVKLVNEFKTMLYLLKRLDSEVDQMDSESISKCKEVFQDFGHLFIERAIKMKSPDIVYKVINNWKISPNCTNLFGFSPLHIVSTIIDTSTPEIIDTLIQNGAKINHKTENGYSALHLAVMYKNIEAVRALVKRKANTHIKDKNGDTPGKIAKEMDNNEIYKVLVIKNKKVHS